MSLSDGGNVLTPTPLPLVPGLYEDLVHSPSFDFGGRTSVLHHLLCCFRYSSPAPLSCRPPLTLSPYSVLVIWYGMKYEIPFT